MGGADGRFRSHLTQTVATALNPWQETQIAAATLGDSEIGSRWLLEAETRCTSSPRPRTSGARRGCSCALLARVVAGAFARSSESGQPIEPALLSCLDEAANIAPLPNPDEIASAGPRPGV